MERLKVVIQPQAHCTQVLAMHGKKEVMRAQLGPPSLVHRLAAPLLLEGLSLWHQCPVSVVLCVDERPDSSPLHRSLSDGYRCGERTMLYVVDVLANDSGNRLKLCGVEDFEELHKLCLGGAHDGE